MLTLKQSPKEGDVKRVNGMREHLNSRERSHTGKRHAIGIGLTSGLIQANVSLGVESRSPKKKDRSFAAEDNDSEPCSSPNLARSEPGIDPSSGPSR